MLLVKATVFAADTAHIELYADTQENGGIKMLTPFTEFRLATRPQDHNLGLRLSTKSFCKTLPVEIKFGNLSCGGSLSKLNSPELSNGTSPFSSGLIQTASLSANLPGYTSFSKPESTFLQIKINNLLKKSQSLCINTWFSPDISGPVVSAMLSDKYFSNQLTLNASCTSGNFYYKDNSANSWFLETPYYTADSHFCSLLQMSADLKNKTKKIGAYTGFSAAVYESPFGPYSSAVRADTKLSIKQTEFYTSAFLNAYEDILTSSGKELEPSFQIKTGILTKKPFLYKNTQLVFVKFGTNVFTNIKLIQTEHPVRLNTGIQFSTDFNSLSFSVSADGKIHSNTKDMNPQEIKRTAIAFQIKNSWYLKTFSPGIVFTVQKKDDDQSINYKVQINMTNTAKHKLSGNCSVSILEKDGDITDKNFSASLTCRLNYKNVIITGKAAAGFSF